MTIWIKYLESYFKVERETEKYCLCKMTINIVEPTSYVLLYYNILSTGSPRF